MTTATTGTGTITLGSAVAPFLTFAQAGVSNGETVSYAIIDGVANSEKGTGVYTTSGTTLTRTVTESTNSNTEISLSGNAQVVITPGKADIVNPNETSTFTAAQTFNDATLKLAGSTSGITTLKANATAGTTVITFPALTDNAVTDTSSSTLSNKTLIAPVVTNYTETLYSPSAGTAFTISLTNGTVQKITSSGNLTITLPSSATGTSYVIIVAYGGTHTLTWAGGSTIKWAGGTTPTPTSASGNFDIYVFI